MHLELMLRGITNSIIIFYFPRVCILSILLLVPVPFFFALLPPQTTNGQLITLKDLVTYQKQSNFIKEFKIPLQDRGLKGITTDSHGNPWFYHSTNKSSTVVMLEMTGMKYTQYDVGGKTVVDNAIINLAGGQLIFDGLRNAIWFTDARTNSIGKLDITSGNIQHFTILTPNSGPMGIALSPDNKNIWFTEITGNKIAALDIESSNNNNSRITEYPVIGPEGQDSGPTFLTFDKKGILWVTMSYSHSILRVEPWALVPGSKAMGISTFSLPKPDTFSPFGVVVTFSSNSNNNTSNKNNTVEKIFLSDHGSSRIILSSGYIDSDPLQSYTSYWTSPSKTYPTTLPSQLVVDKSGSNIYFPEHGGNRISKIDTKSGIMTEYDITTGPLSTALFISVSEDGKKVWFTEWASNKIAYLDATIPVPFRMQVEEKDVGTTPINLKVNEPKTLKVIITNGDTKNNSSSSPSSSSAPALLNEVELSIIGMTDSGLNGVTYTANPPRINMSNNTTSAVESEITLKAEEEGKTQPGLYTILVKSSAAEKDGLFVSLLYPLPIKLDVPVPKLVQPQSPQRSIENSKQNPLSDLFNIYDTSLRGILRLISLPTAIGLIGYMIYSRVKRSKTSKKNNVQK
jgi:streptogramin lyase